MGGGGGDAGGIVGAAATTAPSLDGASVPAKPASLLHKRGDDAIIGVLPPGVRAQLERRPEPDAQPAVASSPRRPPQIGPPFNRL